MNAEMFTSICNLRDTKRPLVKKLVGLAEKYTGQQVSYPEGKGMPLLRSRVSLYALDRNNYSQFGKIGVLFGTRLPLLMAD